MSILQTDRLVRIATNLGEDAFVVRSFSGIEKISGLFSFNLVLASERGDITFDELAGMNTTVTIGSSDGDQRLFNGIITGFIPGQSSDREGFSEYMATLRPTAWLLTRCVDCRVFQDKNVPDIIRQVLDTAADKGIRQKIDFRMSLAGSYDPREICIQYNESDMAFIDRLCAAEGIFYFFEHKNGQHTLVFGDSTEAHKPRAGGNKQAVPFQSTLGGVGDSEAVVCLQPVNKLMTGQYMACDYNFTIPDVDMTVVRSSHQQPASPGRIYEYPGDY